MNDPSFRPLFRVRGALSDPRSDDRSLSSVAALIFRNPSFARSAPGAADPGDGPPTQPVTCATSGNDRHEVRRHLGRRRRPDQASRPPDRRPARSRAPRRRRAVSAGPDHRRADRDGRRRSPTVPTRARWTCSSPPANGSPARCARWPSTTSAIGRSRSPDRRPGSSPTHRTPRRGSSTSVPIASARPWRRI